MISEMVSTEQFSPADSERTETHAEHCVCVCSSTCIAMALLETECRLNPVYRDGNCNRKTRYYPINTHTGCRNCPSFICAVSQKLECKQM